jgi:hypothetical protein
MSISNGEFFQTKLANFIQYTHTHFTDSKFAPLIHQLVGVGIHDAIGYFYTVVRPAGMEKYLEHILQQSHLLRTDFDPVHLTKL